MLDHNDLPDLADFVAAFRHHAPHVAVHRGPARALPPEDPSHPLRVLTVHLGLADETDHPDSIAGVVATMAGTQWLDGWLTGYQQTFDFGQPSADEAWKDGFLCGSACLHWFSTYRYNRTGPQAP